MDCGSGDISSTLIIGRFLSIKNRSNNCYHLSRTIIGNIRRVRVWRYAEHLGWIRYITWIAKSCDYILQESAKHLRFLALPIYPSEYTFSQNLAQYLRHLYIPFKQIRGAILNVLTLFHETITTFSKYFFLSK